MLPYHMREVRAELVEHRNSTANSQFVQEKCALFPWWR
ncbi:hypothetical protein PPTG_22681 [Phytophthora nicotianae INRA-310]|uniref:Uncharacterized protein n=1 Tax=Phytophthora nicotianae (strain INRA-310) TaxID=761204 RepID=W2QDS2_PHYN3|nr:hypothetical protein PPTG_22681 [Phytophthora nicotianae INRA-310]ETN10684.1 hypothetical protein PPTG_22681 [Phytophthora nicotianae INRA-310]